MSTWVSLFPRLPVRGIDKSHIPSLGPSSSPFKLTFVRESEDIGDGELVYYHMGESKAGAMDPTNSLLEILYTKVQTLETLVDENTAKVQTLVDENCDLKSTNTSLIEALWNLQTQVSNLENTVTDNTFRLKEVSTWPLLAMYDLIRISLSTLNTKATDQVGVEDVDSNRVLSMF